MFAILEAFDQPVGERQREIHVLAAVLGLEQRQRAVEHEGVVVEAAAEARPAVLPAGQQATVPP